MKPTIICATCMEIHGRDTNTPIQCGVCRKIVGCFWHDHNSAHIRACRRAKAGLPPLEELVWKEDSP